MTCYCRSNHVPSVDILLSKRILASSILIGRTIIGGVVAGCGQAAGGDGGQWRRRRGR
jgi:hypothetical protein